MSCLDIPRVHFGGMFFTNVCTSNNDDLQSVAAKFRPVVDPVNVTVNSSILAMTNDEARTWFENFTTDGNNLNGGWNHYGDHLIGFDGASVSEVVLNYGQSGGSGSALVGAEVSLPNNPKMVDVDPTGSANTQLFLGGFKIGDGNNGLQFNASPGAQTFFRWIGLRNLSAGGFTAAAATWQFAIPKGSGLTFNGSDPALLELKKASEAAKGLLVQFCTYYLQPGFNASQLHAMFKAGQKTQNPARGHMVGTVGVWNEEDLGTFPNGRQLQATSSAPVPCWHSPAVGRHSVRGGGR